MNVLTERTNQLALDDDFDDVDEQQHEHARVSLKRLSTNLMSRRRRRSSARFLKLNNDEEDEDPAVMDVPSTQDLGQVYQHAIRMNAENKITASNSWNLNLIDHMDRFLGRPSLAPNASAVPLEDTLGPISGVNFTKASCTLDASVKIYSYRVDDVHLTSYKVLANLNRTDHGKNDETKKSKDSQVMMATPTTSTGGSATNDEPPARDQQRRGARNTNTDTLETNLANLNIHKLDAAFDIDPLFHKMSKTFDEGGAKGLLLANLGVSTKGCNIVFDSTLEEATPEEETKQPHNEHAANLIDVSTLQARIDSALGGQSLYQLPLVPQLALLRRDYSQLKQEGFLEQEQKSDRYAAPKEIEIEADRSIHIEAIERSRASQADIGRSLMAELKDDEDSSFGDDDGAGFAADDFGGDDDDFDNDAPHGDVFPLSSIHDGNHRFSSESFQTTFQSKQPPSQASILLDAIASGDISGSRSKYEYFNKKALESIQGNNQWAGSAHWRKLQPKRTMVSKTAVVEDGERATAAKKKRSKNKATGSGGLLIDISKTSADLKVLLKKPPKAKKGASQPLQMTKAAVSKAAKDDNLLPLDAGINVENLTCLFSRPNTNVMDLATPEPGVPLRQVGFGGIETWGNDDNSYGDDYQGSGIAFGDGYNEDDAHDPEDFCIPELEGIRKVAKVRIGYATVAKQVDVKRLKTDLWLELERTFKERNIQVDAEKDDDESVDSSFAQKAEQLERLNESPIKDSTAPLSFQQTVRDMQASQSQTDVTLPFYFICILHLANEKGLILESTGLEDFIISSCL